MTSNPEVWPALEAWNDRLAPLRTPPPPKPAPHIYDHIRLIDGRREGDKK